MNPEERFVIIVKSLKGLPLVSVGASKRGFGSSALCVSKKIFAMISSKNRFVVKLPKSRVAELVAVGAGSKFEPSPGRVMSEWLAVDPEWDGDWLSLAREAMKFVANK
jgi:hypothetical protein